MEFFAFNTLLHFILTWFSMEVHWNCFLFLFSGFLWNFLYVFGFVQCEYYIHIYLCKGTSLVAQMIKRLPTMWETRVQSLGREDHLEKDMAPHSSILAWKIPWTEEPSRVQSMGSQRVGHDWATSLSQGWWKYCKSEFSDMEA